jgi:hypothetical protein
MKQGKKVFTILDAIKHPDIFGSLPALKSLDTWTSWIVWLKAIHALPMTPDELAIYQRCTGRTRPPAKRPSEVYTICGRRSGKSFIASLSAVFAGAFSDPRPYLNAGELAVILTLARDRDQARIIFNYISGIIHAVPAILAMVVAERSDEIELDNATTFLVKTSDFRAIRGITVKEARLDETSFWDSAGISPDHEVLTALRPAMATIPHSQLICISTPYAQSGVLYEAHREYFGKDDEHTLIWQADTRTMNPTIDEGLIQREIERDPEGASAEWLATFRSDLQAAFSPEALQACVIKDRDELPPSPLISYSAFVDPSGGRHDAFTLAIAHRESDIAVLDLVRAWYPPFDPGLVVGEASEIAKQYGVLSVVGDNYGGEWPVASFRDHGITYERAEKHKSELYLGLIPTVNAKKIELLDDKRLMNELRRLERRRGRTGKDTVDHPPKLHDDLANSTAGVCDLILNAETRLRFDQQKLREMLQATCEPGFHGYLHESPDNILHVKPEADPKGPVRMWEEPKIGRSYVIGAQGGIESSCAYVLDRRSLEVCAEFRGGRIDQDRFAEEVIRLGKTYGNALIGTEDDDCPTYQAILRLGYPRLYKHDVGFVKAQWLAAAVDDLSALIRKNWACPSRELVEEMLNVVCRDDGKTDLHGKGRVAAAAITVRVKNTSGLESIYPSLNKKREGTRPASAESETQIGTR